MNRRATILSGLVLVVVIILSLVLISLSGGFTKVTTGVRMYVSPSDSKVFVDGKQLKPNKLGQIAADPGKHTVTVKRADFKDMEQTITVTQGALADVFVLLLPANANGEKVLTSGSQQQVREQIGYLKSQNDAANIQKAYPVLKDMPVVTADVRIDYGVSKLYPNDPLKVAFFVTTYNTQDRQRALNWFTAKGLDPKTLEIYYRFFDDAK